VQPSAKREGFATTPNVSWDEVGALEHVRCGGHVTSPCETRANAVRGRRELQLAITEPIKHPQRFGVDTAFQCFFRNTGAGFRD
jgi:ribosome biogenesis ATPase